MIDTREQAHELQHSDSPTWCVHCGTFDIYCSGTECRGERTRRFDTDIPGNARRMAEDFFGIAADGKEFL